MMNYMETFPTMTLDPEALRSAMRAWSAGVTIVTAAHGEDRHGMTVNSFTSISLTPPLIIISLQKNTRTHELVMKSQAFGLTILAAEQVNVSDLFAGRMPDVQDRLAAVPTETLVTGSPLIVGGLSWLDCRILQTYDAGLSTLFISEVVAARGTGVGEPLLYHNREYWTLAALSVRD
jgi:flavin reductase (DIM6/NTAB) family NADH-FMN oxidoreductase RutF